MKIMLKKLNMKPLFMSVMAMWVFSFFLVPPALAIPVLDFGVFAPASGTISYAGGIAPLVGSGISVNNVVGLGTPSIDGITAACVNCVLTFTTGSLVSSDTNSWNFGGGSLSSISIVGGIELDGGGIGGGDIALGTILLSGNFQNATVLNLGGTFQIAGASFMDMKDPSLLAYYGLPNVQYGGNFNLSFNANALPPSSFTSTTIYSGDITNQQVPEPTSLMLLGTRLLGLGILGRKRFNQQFTH